MAKKPLISVTPSSGNVFADIGVPEPEEALAKAQLASRIREIVRDSRLTQVAAAAVMGIDQPKVSALLGGRLTNFSSERLMRLLTSLGQDVLGFQRKTETPLGEARWLTVVSPDNPDGTELLLERDGHPAVGPFKRALVDDGIPFTSFGVADVQAEYERLLAPGIRFTQPHAEMGSVTTAVLDDTCGNLIQICGE